MFKGKVRVYKNINWKEESFKKTFNNEKDFNHFIEKNPDLKELANWEATKLPDHLFDINSFFDEAYQLWNHDFFKEMETDMKKLFDKSKKLLGK